MKRSAPEDPNTHLSPIYFIGLIFGILVFTGTILSFRPFPLMTQFIIFLLGMGMPVVILTRKVGFWSGESGPFDETEFLRPIPVWAWGLLIAGVLLLRFWGLTTVPIWPTGDEGLHGIEAIRLSQKWDWQFFRYSQDPPFIIWIEALFFRLVPNSFFDLWFPSALFSVLTVWAGWSVSRRSFSPSLSWLFCCGLAFSFWPLFIGRFSLGGVLVPLWMLISFYGMVRYWGSRGTASRTWSLGIGLWSGLGYLTFHSAPLVSLFLAGLFFFLAVHKKKRAEDFWVFLGAFMVAIIPLAWEWSVSSYGRHVLAIAGWTRGHGLSSQVATMFQYVAALFWGGVRGASYVPTIGGFLNPLWDGCFFIGLAEVIHFRRTAWAKWIGAALLVLILPGILSLNVEGYRVVQMLPIVSFVAVMGLRTLIKNIPYSAGPWFLSLFLILALGLDLVRLFHPFVPIQGNPGIFSEAGKSYNRHLVFRLLKERENKEGPGFVLGDWDVHSDQTLNTSSYFFNAAFDPQLNPSTARWLAVLTDIQYGSFLKKRFPEGQWIPLPGLAGKDGDELLGILPVEDKDRQVIARWVKADEVFQGITWNTGHPYDLNSVANVEKIILEKYPLVQGDPFLEASFWEKVGAFYYGSHESHYREHLRALELAVQRGYPAAHLYYQLAELYTIGGQDKEALAAVKKAKESERLYPLVQSQQDEVQGTPR